MGTVSILFSLFYAIILTLLLVTLFGSVRSWRSSWPLFVIIFFGALAAGVWVIPVGPVIWEYYFLPGFLVALIFALLLAAAMPARSRNDRNKKEEEKEARENESSTTYYRPHKESQEEIYKGKESVAQVMLGGISWVIIILLTFIILAGLLMEPAF